MSDWLTIRKDVSPRVRWIFPFLSWGIIVLLWVLLPYWQGPHFSLLPRPLGVIRSFGMLWSEYDLLGNVFMSWWRIAQAFFWCAVVAIPLGILMSSYRGLFELINPVAAPMRAMPLTAFLPAFIALFGIDETEKIAFLWFGMFFYLLAVVVEEANRVDNALAGTAYTLGAKPRQALWLIFRASLPAIFSSFRILYDIGWTYVILAEMLNARKGVGYMVGSGPQGIGLRARICGDHRNRHCRIPVPISADFPGGTSISLAQSELHARGGRGWRTQRHRTPKGGQAWKLRNRKSPYET